jgi:hypothetical protein
MPSKNQQFTARWACLVSIFLHFAAAGLGIKELLPPYIGVDLQLNDLLTGVVFASGGSGYDPLTSIPAVTKYITQLSQ